MSEKKSKTLERDFSDLVNLHPLVTLRKESMKCIESELHKILFDQLSTAAQILNYMSGNPESDDSSDKIAEKHNENINEFLENIHSVLKFGMKACIKTVLNPILDQLTNDKIIDIKLIKINKDTDDPCEECDSKEECENGICFENKENTIH